MTRNALVDVPGIRVGHHTATAGGYLTGTTVVLAPDGGMTASVDVRGGGPATHETDLLHPTAAVESIHALVLTGGSAYGLAACTGVMLGLEERGIGLPVGAQPGELVPIVPGAALFDLGRGGAFRARPTADFGLAALDAAFATGSADYAGNQNSGGSAIGAIGAGSGAVAGNLKSGIGQASVTLAGGVVVAALVVCNAAGSPIDPGTGDLLGARHLAAVDGPPPPAVAADRQAALTDAVYRRPERPAFRFDQDHSGPEGAIEHTTLAVVATSARLTKSRCAKMAAVAHDGMARAVNPVHTMFDGDLVFGVATGGAGSATDGHHPDPLELHEILTAAADVVTRAIVRGMLAARSTSTAAGGWPSWGDLAHG